MIIYYLNLGLVKNITIKIVCLCTHKQTIFIDISKINCVYVYRTIYFGNVKR